MMPVIIDPLAISDATESVDGSVKRWENPFIENVAFHFESTHTNHATMVPNSQQWERPVARPFDCWLAQLTLFFC